MPRDLEFSYYITSKGRSRKYSRAYSSNLDFILDRLRNLSPKPQITRYYYSAILLLIAR